MPRNFRYQQHFLKHPKLVYELIGHTNIRSGDTVYDLGAGSGVITTALAKKAKHVIAVESEPKALKRLRENTRTLSNVEIVEADIMSVAPLGRYKVFSNIPFHLSTQVVELFAHMKESPLSLNLIVQRQFAKKLVPGDTHFTNALSAQIGPWFSVRIRKPLRRSDFTPPPAVDTVLLEIKPREVSLVESSERVSYETFVLRIFQDTHFYERLCSDSIQTKARPSQLTLQEIIALHTIHTGTA